MRGFAVAVGIAILAALATPATWAESPAPTEEQIEARLREIRQQAEALRAEELRLQKQLKAVREAPRGRIQAEVEGVLRWRDEGVGIREIRDRLSRPSIN